MRKVMVVLPDLGVGGGQSTAIEIVHYIKNMDLSFEVVSLYASQDSALEAKCRDYGIKIVFLRKRKGFDFRNLLDVNREIKKYKPDVVHAHLRVMPHLLLPMILNHTGRRLYTVHNVAEKDGRGFTKYILKIAFKLCHVVPVAISDLCRESISSFYGIPDSDIPCIYIGTDITRFKRSKPYSLLNDDVINFVAVGRLTRQKNYLLMIKAFADALKTKDNIYLTIVGGGEDYAELQDYIEKNDLSEHVILAGLVPSVKDYLSNSHVYLMSSDWEGLPQTILEAMAMGLPIISTRAGGVVDVVQDQINGLLVDCGDQQGLTEAILELACSGNKRIEISKRNEIDVEKYSFERCAQGYEQLYLKG